MTPETLAQITKFSLIGIFALILLGMLIAGIIGWKKGIWRSTYKMMFMFTLVLLAWVLLTPISQALADMPLSFLPFKSIKMINQTTGEYIYVSVTTFEQTIKECAGAYYIVNHLPYTAKEIASLSVAIADTAVKFTYVLVSMLLVAIFGTLLQWILWHVLFKRIIPKACQRLVKIKWLGMLEGVVSFGLLAVLFISPLSSMTNIANYNYQRKELVSNNQTVKYINAFLDEYNNSIIGKLYGLTADENGLTFDAKMLDWITATEVDGTSFSLYKELDTLSDIGLIYVSGLLGDTFNVSIRDILSDENIESFFDTISDSELLTTIIPIFTQIAFNLDTIKNTVDYSMVNITKEQFVSDLDNIEKFFKTVVASGVIDNFLNEDGSFNTSAQFDATSLIEDIASDDEKLNGFLAIFDSASDSHFLDMLIPSTMMMLAQSSPEIGRFLPATWDEMNNLDWGKELGILFTSFSKLIDIDDSLLDAIFSGGSVESGLKKSAAGGPESTSSDLTEIILKHVGDIGEIIFGKAQTNGTPIDIDKFGVTNNQDNDYSKYNLFDGQLSKWYGEPLLELLGDTMVSSLDDEAKTISKEKLSSLINGLNVPIDWRANYKKELANTFDVLEELAKYEDVLEVIQSPEEMFTDLSTIDDDLVNAMSLGMKQMDESGFLYATLAEVLKDAFTNAGVSGLSDVGIDVNEVKDGFDECISKFELGKELSFVFDNIKDFGKLQKLTSNGDPIDSLKDEEQYSAIANSLDVLYLSNIFNASYSNRGNYFNALNKIFEIADQNGLEFKDYLKSDDGIQWVNSRIGNKINPDAYDKNISYTTTLSDGSLVRGENGNIALAFAAISETEIIDIFSKEGFSIDDLTSNENRNAIKTVLTSCSYSEVMSATLGQYLDIQFDGQGLIDEESNFENVVDWADEAVKLDNILGSLATLDLDLSNLDITAVSDVVALNDMLHNLADSSIFVKQNDDKTTSYTFNNWLLGKLQDSLGGENDLLKDPDNWDAAMWGEKTDISENYSIVKSDFKSLDEKNDWSNTSYVKNFNYSSYGDENDYFDNPAFYNNYFIAANYANQDEIGHIVEIVYWMSCKGFDANDVTSASPETLEGALKAVNNSNTLRMIIYNAFDTINDTIKQNSDIFSLDQGRVEYLINSSVDSLGRLLNTEDSRDGRENEIECVIDLYKVYKADISSLNNIGDLKPDSGSEINKIDVISSGLKALLNSNVYHKLGPKDAGELTALQYSLKILYENDTFDGLLYNSNSDKDIASTAYNGFKTVGEDIGKGEYIIRNFFTYGESANYIKEASEIDDIFSSIEIILDLADASGNIDFTTIDFNDSNNINTIKNFLISVDNTETIYDVVSNAFYKVFNERTSYSGFGVDMTAADPYFMYTNTYDIYVGSKTNPNYANRVTEEEITRIMNVMSKSQDSSINFNDMTSLDAVDTETISTLKNITQDIHDSYMMHSLSRLNGANEDYTIFEQLMKKLVSDTQLQAKSGASDAELKERIKNVSILENNSENTPVLNSLGGYAVKWFDANKGEADFMFDFFSYLADNDLSSANSLQLNSLTPTLMNGIMTKLNAIYLSQNALGTVLSEGFDSIGLASMTEYKDAGLPDIPSNYVDTADYFISQESYGGSDPFNAVEGTQIYLLNTILNATYDDVNGEYIDLGNNIADAVRNDDSLLGVILKFVYESEIYSSSFTDASYMSFGAVEARSVFMYNTFDNAGLSRYITGFDSSDDEYSKYVGIATIEKIFNFEDADHNLIFDSQAEAATLTKLIKDNEGGLINSVNASNISSEENKNLITGIIASTYDYVDDMYDYSSYTRYYLASEIVGGILDEVLHDEYLAIRDNTNVFSWSNTGGETSCCIANYGNDISFKAKVVDGNLNDLTKDSYNLINEIEKRGLYGGLSALGDLTKATPEYSNIDTYFAMMGEDGKTQSVIATTYYISRIGKYIKMAADVKAGYPLKTWSGFVDNPLSDPTFSYETYGTVVKTFLLGA